ncbi:hypothetical protein ACJX0J_012349, partial [Zea mays]
RFLERGTIVILFFFLMITYPQGSLVKLFSYFTFFAQKECEDESTKIAFENLCSEILLSSVEILKSMLYLIQKNQGGFFYQMTLKNLQQNEEESHLALEEGRKAKEHKIIVRTVLHNIDPEGLAEDLA